MCILTINNNNNKQLKINNNNHKKWVWLKIAKHLVLAKCEQFKIIRVICYY